MQTLTFGRVVASSHRHARPETLGDPHRDAPPAFDRLEAPVITPLAEPAAGMEADRVHPRVDRPHTRAAVEVVDNVGIGNIHLILEDDAIRLAKDPRIPKRLHDPLHQTLAVERLTP